MTPCTLMFPIIMVTLNFPVLLRGNNPVFTFVRDLVKFQFFQTLLQYVLNNCPLLLFLFYFYKRYITLQVFYYLRNEYSMLLSLNVCCHIEQQFFRQSIFLISNSEMFRFLCFCRINNTNSLGYSTLHIKINMFQW